MYKYKTLLASFLTAVTLVSVTGKSAMAQATASGSVFIFNPNTGYSQSVSGEITIPAGSFNGLEVTPNFTQSLFGPPDFFPSNVLQAPIQDLLINPLGINFTLAPSLNAQTATLLSSYNVNGQLPEIISILRANPDLLREGTQNQAIATGQVTLLAPDGSVQSVSGEIALPNGLFYQGWVDNFNVSSCNTSATGCLMIMPVDPNIGSFGAFLDGSPKIEQLIINPGPIALFADNGSSYDLNAAAGQLLSGIPLNQLSNIVSIIRAGSGSNGPFSSRVQGRAMGVTLVSTPSGTTQSVSGEISLPVGLYFDENFNCGFSSCLAILPDIQWYGTSADTAYINELIIDPGLIQPGDPIFPTGFFRAGSFDFNAAASDILYQYIDSGSLSEVVSVIRAGAGSDSLTPKNRLTAKASGSVTLTLPNGAVQSVTAELTLPNSLYYSGANPSNINNPAVGINCSNGPACFVVTPILNTAGAIALNDPNLLSITTLSIDPGPPNDPTIVRGWDFDAAAASALIQAPDLQAQVSIIRAGAGASNGLE